MGRLAERWTRDQRAVIVRAQLDQRMTARRAVEAAKAGKLGNIPFDMPLNTARDYARRERQRRDLAATPEAAKHGTHAAVQTYLRRLHQVADTLTKDLVRQGRKAPPRKAIEAAKLIQELQRIDPPSKTNGQPRPKRDTTEQPAERSFVTQLAAQIAPSDEPPSTNTQQNTPGTKEHTNAENSPTQHHTTTTPNTADSPVFTRASVSARRAALGMVGQQLG
jgi:hypothetical protein